MNGISTYAGVYEAQESPLEPGVFIEPNSSTEIMPPTVQVNEVAVYTSGVWGVQPDFRGETIYSQSTSAAEVVTEIGAIPDGWGLVMSGPTPDQQCSIYKALCVATLQDAETTMSRIYQAVILGKTTYQTTDVVNWVNWMAAVRVSGANELPESIPELPEKPPYPANT